MRISQALALMQRLAQEKKGREDYERTRQAINAKPGSSAPVGSHDWKREQSESVIESEPLSRMMVKSQKMRDAFQKKLQKGKAWDDEDGSYGVFDKDGYSAVTGADGKEADEVTIDPATFKAEAPRVREIMEAVNGKTPDVSSIGNMMVNYRNRFGDQPIDPMKMKHMILGYRGEVEVTPEDEGGSSLSGAELERFRRMQQTLPAKK